MWTLAILLLLTFHFAANPANAQPDRKITSLILILPTPPTAHPGEIISAFVTVKNVGTLNGSSTQVSVGWLNNFVHDRFPSLAVGEERTVGPFLCLYRQ